MRKAVNMGVEWKTWLLGMIHRPRISSYKIIIRFSPIRGTGRESAHAEYRVVVHGGDALLINVLTALMRCIILAFTLISCCPPYPA